MFFGLTNSLATFQMMMDNIFHEEITQGWLKIYMDDLIIASEDDEKIHQQCVDQVLHKIKLHDLFLKAKKCSFHKKQVKYLGMITQSKTFTASLDSAISIEASLPTPLQ